MSLRRYSFPRLSRTWPRLRYLALAAVDPPPVGPNEKVRRTDVAQVMGPLLVLLNDGLGPYVHRIFTDALPVARFFLDLRSSCGHTVRM